jgi:hypothetical protein
VTLLPLCLLTHVAQGHTKGRFIRGKRHFHGRRRGRRCEAVYDFAPRDGPTVPGERIFALTQTGRWAST